MSLHRIAERFASFRTFHGKWAGLDRLLVVSLLLVALDVDVLGQRRSVDCAPPRGVSRADEVGAIVADGEADCSRAQTYLDESRDWSRTASDLRKQADRLRGQAEDLRKEASRLRRDVEDLRERITELQREAMSLSEDDGSSENPVVRLNLEEGSFRGGLDSSFVIPMPGASQFEERLEQYAQARGRFVTVRLNAIDEEVMSVEGMIQVDEELAADKEASAVDLDQLALNNERTALEADASGAIAEEIAALAERSAILHHVHASTQFIALSMSDPRAKRNVSRAVGYIEKYKHLMSGLDAREADRILAEAKIVFEL